jgi:hypothetical protein
LAHLSSINSVRVGFPAGLETSAWYLAAWTANALHATPTLSGGAQGLQLELAAPDFQVLLGRDGDRLVTTVDAVSTCASLPAPSDYLLMREELGVMRRDPVFESTLASAARLAVKQ